MSEFIITQSTDTFSYQSRQLVGTPRSTFASDKNEALVQKTPIDGSIQNLEPALLKSRLLHYAHHSTIAGHSVERMMYDLFCRDYYWPHVVPGVYNTINDCSQCPPSVLDSNINDSLELLPPAGLSEFVPIDILGTLRTTNTKDRFVVLITNQYSKLRRGIPTGKITSTQVRQISFHEWVILYGNPYIFLSDNAQPYLGKIFTSLCTYFEVKRFTTTDFYA